MKKITLLFILSILLTAQTINAQSFFTKTGYISFFSHTAVMDIKAENMEVAGVLDAAYGTIKFQALIKSFKFEKAKMQEDFNKPDYMNSSTYPKAEFTGNITNLKTINFKKDASYKLSVSGNLTIHGATKKIDLAGTVIIKNGLPTLKSVFTINRTDYNVILASFVDKKIAKEIEITINCPLVPVAK